MIIDIGVKYLDDEISPVDEREFIRNCRQVKKFGASPTFLLTQRVIRKKKTSGEEGSKALAKSPSRELP